MVSYLGTTPRFLTEEYLGELDVRACDLYKEMCVGREPYLERAYEAAKITIPSLFVRYQETPWIELPTPWSAIGARSVNYLASALLLAYFPPNLEVVRLEADPVLAAQIGGSEKLKQQLDAALALYSEKLSDEMETIGLRAPMYEALRHMIVGGNSLFYLPKKGAPRNIPLDHYTIERDGSGNILTIVVCEKINERALPNRAREALKYSKRSKSSSLYVTDGAVTYSPSSTKGKPKEHELYTVIRRLNDQDELVETAKYEIYQEIDDVPIQGSYDDKFTNENLPFLPITYAHVTGESYSRSRVEEYWGHLSSAEGFTQVLYEGASAIAKVIFGIDPAAGVDADEITEAANGEFVDIKPDQVGAITSQKTGDLNFAAQLLSRINEEISRDFGLSFTPREGERVTAEEIRLVAQELDKGNGGIYSVGTQKIQRPIFQLLMARLEERNEAPVINIKEGDKTLVKPRIVTGLEALGRGNDAARIDSALAVIQQLGPTALETLDMSALVGKVLLSRGINPNEVTFTQEEIAEHRQQAMQTQTIQDVAPEAVRQLGASANGAAA